MDMSVCPSASIYCYLEGQSFLWGGVSVYFYGSVHSEFIMIMTFSANSLISSQH
jgi:hypothetical protein